MWEARSWHLQWYPLVWLQSSCSLGKLNMTKSAIAHHCLQSGHIVDFDGMRILGTMSNKWHIDSGGKADQEQRGWFNEGDVDIPRQYTRLMQMATTWCCKQLDKKSKWQPCLTPNTLPIHVQHPKETPPIMQPSRYNVQPGHKSGHVCVPETLKTRRAPGRAHTSAT